MMGKIRVVGAVGDRLRENPKWINAIWTSDFDLIREDAAGKNLVARLDALPDGETGRDKFLFMSIATPFGGADFFWANVFKATKAEKLTGHEWLKRVGNSSPYAQLFTWLNGDKILVLYGWNEKAFQNVNPERVFMSIPEAFEYAMQDYPTMTLRVVSRTETTAEMVAETNCDAEVFWETTGGSLTYARTPSGKTNVVTCPDLSGVRVKVGFKDFTGMTEVVL